MNKYNVIIVGAGPAGIFTAVQLVKNNYQGSILMIEKGKDILNRRCPKHKLGHCVKCEPCAITTGFSGAGAFSDGKLSLSPEVGGDLPELIGYDTVEELIKYADDIYLEFGADERIEGLGSDEAIQNIRKRAIHADLKLVDCPIRHLGTEKAQEVYGRLQSYLIDKGVEIRFNTSVENIDTYDLEGGPTDYCTGVWVRPNNKVNPEYIRGDHIIIAAGRRGAEWLFNVCNNHNIEHIPGTVDIGVRVECRNEVMEEINKALYEGKLIGYPKPFKNKVRTFCQNPGGVVSEERYDEGLSTVNGHSYKETKTNNTNFSILCSHNFSVPFDDPIAYAKMVGKLTNMLADNHILVQRFGDILDGKRTWQKEMNRGNLTPTLPDAVAGDITAAIPYRTMTNIIEFIFMLDKVVPGIANKETLLYAPELKFYSNKVTLDKNLNTSMKNLYCLGDASGWTRGLMMASVMGVYMANKLLEEK